ncbi:hypothetical protein [Devosia sp.]|uniref:hypothetical protein n=1 Tax=Devosia sp. TaxID=1871048 RepID=UPI003A8D34A7
MSVPAFAANDSGAFPDIHSTAAAGASVASGGAVRSTAQAILHALPAIGLIAGYLWMAIATPVVLLLNRMPGLPVVGWGVLVVLAVPGVWLSWRIIRQCIAVEREII